MLKTVIYSKATNDKNAKCWKIGNVQKQQPTKMQTVENWKSSTVSQTISSIILTAILTPASTGENKQKQFKLKTKDKNLILKAKIAIKCWWGTCPGAYYCLYSVSSDGNIQMYIYWGIEQTNTRKTFVSEVLLLTAKVESYISLGSISLFNQLIFHVSNQTTRQQLQRKRTKLVLEMNSYL